MEPIERDVDLGDLTVHLAEAGSGPAVLLLHGFPRTWRLWSEVIPVLARRHRVVAPDLRGLGGTSRAESGYDAATLAGDAVRLLDALDIDDAEVVALDAGVPPAVALALTHPERVRRLVVSESLVGRLPGAEPFLAGGPPWWFGFHQVPGLAERVLVGHEAAYVDWFLAQGTHDGRGIDPAVRDAFVTAYAGAESLRCACEHYRAMPANADLFEDLVRTRRLTMPVLAVGAAPVGPALAGQLAGITDDLTSVQLDRCGHLVPLDAPDRLLAAMGAAI